MCIRDRFDGHLRDELLQAELERLREALLDQRTAEAAAAPGGSDEHTQLADVLGPAQLVDQDRSAADHRGAVPGDEACQLAGLERAHPDVDNLRVTQVAWNE